MSVTRYVWKLLITPKALLVDRERESDSIERDSREREKERVSLESERVRDS